MSDQIFASAKRIQATYRSTVQAIRLDQSLSDQGKREKFADAYRTAKTGLDSLKQGHAADIEKQQQELRKAAFGLSYPLNATEGDKELIRMSYRDAMGRVNAISTADDALKTLQEAQVIGDKQMVKAVAQAAYNKGWNAVLNEYATISPGSADAMRDLTRLEADQQDAMGRFGTGMMFSVDAPPEATSSDLHQAAPAQTAAE